LGYMPSPLVSVPLTVQRQPACATSCHLLNYRIPWSLELLAEGCHGA
jgi:hypothetical protein